MKIEPTTDIQITISRSEASSVLWILKQAKVKDKATGFGMTAIRFADGLEAAIRGQDDHHTQEG